MDCYFHNAVPSVAVCNDCMRTICATCRDPQGICPSCRLERRIKARQAARQELGGQVGPSNPPPPNPPPQGTEVPYVQASSTALAAVPLETRVLLGLGYPLWPVAALTFLSPSDRPEVRRQALQAIAFNFGTFGLYFALSAIAHIPLLGLSAWPLLIALLPIWLVASVIFGIKVWNGDDVRVPIVSEWLDRTGGQRVKA